MHFRLHSLALLSISVLSFSYASVAEPAGRLVKRADFRYRFYEAGNCDHDTEEPTFPENSQDPEEGSKNSCLNSPWGTDWQRVETDVDFAGEDKGVVVYCDQNCAGDETGYQKGHCHAPPSGCAIGSFKVFS